MKCLRLMVVTGFLFLISCKQADQKPIAGSDDQFSSFENRFLDQYWKQYPANAIAAIRKSHLGKNFYNRKNGAHVRQFMDKIFPGKSETAEQQG